MKYINTKYIKNLKDYKYSSEDHSIFSATVGKWWWELVLRFTPKSLAPNTITLIGLLFTIESLILSYIFNPSLDQHMPPIFCLIFGLNLFLYQTFDAVDGKQARRTNSSSPLGQLFDHTCDSLNLTLLVITLLSVTETGGGKPLLYFLLIGYTVFYLATLEEYETGMLVLPTVNAPVEGIVFLVLLLVVSSFLGGGAFIKKPFFEMTLFSMSVGVSIYTVTLVFLLSVAIFAILLSLKSLFSTPKFRISHLIPIALLVTLTLLWAAPGGAMIARKFPFLFALTVGFIFSKTASNVILAHLVKSPLFASHPWDVYFVLLIGAINTWVLHWDDSVVIRVLCLYSTISFIVMAYMIIDEICSELNIRCFRIKEVKEE